MRLLIAMLCAALAASSCGYGQSGDTPEPENDDRAAQQENEKPKPPPPCYPDERLYQLHIIYRDRPYSGVRVSTCEKQMEDGTVFKATRATWEWRDSQGRMRVEKNDRSPELSKRREITVYDPVAHVQWNWYEGELAGTTAALVRYKKSEDFIEPEIHRRVLPDGTLDPPIMAHMANPDLPRQKQIILKSTNINGVWAEGEQMIFKSFPGDPANTSKHLEIRTDEFWFSVDLELEIRHIANDPKQGKSIVNLLKIDRREPDAALFRPPADYDVLDTTPKYPIPERNPLLVIPVKEPNRAASPQ